ncbi:MAG: hypothetical protein K1X92_01640 [Bacteroidia bacterium]|nr:hypothetical protein [Bacteroidia bacterium]
MFCTGFLGSLSFPIGSAQGTKEAPLNRWVSEAEPNTSIPVGRILQKKNHSSVTPEWFSSF